MRSSLISKFETETGLIEKADLPSALAEARDLTP